MMLAEVLVTTTMFSFVLLAILGLLDTAAKVAPKDQERAHAIREAQVGLNRMASDLRQAYTVLGTSPESMEVLVRLRKDDPSTPAVEKNTSRHVYYNCGQDNPGKCVRYEAAVGATLPTTGQTVISRVLNWDAGTDPDRRVFTYPDDDDFGPSYVKLRVEVPAAGERKNGYSHKVVLEDGFYARNLSRND